jgi:hypothetical protein
MVRSSVAAIWSTSTRISPRPLALSVPSLLEQNDEWARSDASAAQFGYALGSTMSNAPLTVGDIAIERIGRLSHTAQKVAHIGGCNTKSKVLRHPDRHLIVREIITKKLLEVIEVLNVPNRGPCHL